MMKETVPRVRDCAAEMREADRLFKDLLKTGDRDTARLVLRALIRADAGDDAVRDHHDAAVAAVRLASGEATAMDRFDAEGLWGSAFPVLEAHAARLTR